MLGYTQSLFNTPLRAFSPSFPWARHLLVKIDSGGNVQWARLVCCNSRGIYETADGSFLVVGDRPYEQKDKTTKTNTMLVKLDSGGKIKWSQTYDSGYNDSGTTVVETRDGEIMIGGAVQIPGSDYDALLIKLTSDGQPVWAKKYEYEKQQGLFSLIETSDRGWMLMGPHKEGNSVSSVLLMKVSSKGDIAWAKTYNSNGHYDRGTAMIQGYNNSYLVVGRSDDINTAGGSGEDPQGAAILVNEKGDVIASDYIAHSALMSAAQTGDGEYMVTGTYGRSDSQTPNMFIAYWVPIINEKSGPPFSSVPITMNERSLTLSVDNGPLEDDFIQNLDVTVLQVPADQALTNGKGDAK